MGRRRMTLRRIDPWSVLKFGFVGNLSLLAIWMLGASVVWFFIQQLRLIDKVCEIAADMGFVQCAVNGGNLFRLLFLFGLLMVVVNTGLLVFLAFLHNLIADLVGGLSFTFVDESPAAAQRVAPSSTTTEEAAARQPTWSASAATPTEEHMFPAGGAGVRDGSEREASRPRGS